MALQIPEVGGRTVQAFEQSNPNQVFGKKTEAVSAATTALAGSYAAYDGSGDAAIGKTFDQLGAVIGDVGVKMQNLKVASETAKRKMQEEEWRTAELQAHKDVEDVAATKEITPEDRASMFRSSLDGRIRSINQKYKYETAVGDTIDQSSSIFNEASGARYDNTVVAKSTADFVLGQGMKLFNQKKDNVILDIQQNGLDSTRLMGQFADAVNQFDTPEFIAASGGKARAQELKQRFAKEFWDDTFKSFITQNPEAAAKILSTTGDTDALIGMDASTRDQLLRTAQYEVRTVRADRKAALTEMQNKNEYELTLGVLDGKIGVGDIDKAYRDNLIDQGHAERLIGRLYSEQERKAREAEHRADRLDRQQEKVRLQLQPVEDAINTGMPLDAKNPSHVRAADTYWNQYVLPTLKGKTPQEQMQAVVQFSSTLGVLPRGVKSSVISQLNSNDPAKVKAGSESLLTLTASNPLLTHSFDDSTLTLASLVDAGEPPERARLAVDKSRSMSKEERDYLSTKYKDAQKKNDNELQSLFGIKVGSEVYGRYDEFKKNFYVLSGGNEDAAREAAKAAIKRDYGVSGIGGTKRVMPMPPELLYGGAKGGDWIDKQATKELQSTFNLSPGRWRLDADHQTMNPTGDSGVSYSVTVLDANGMPVGVLRDKDGNPVRWKPDFATSDEGVSYKKGLEDERAKAVRIQQEAARLREMPTSLLVTKEDVNKNSNWKPRGWKQ